VAQKLEQLKKKRNNLSNFSKEFLIIFNGDFIRLKKGMNKQEVMKILGEPFKIENCSSEINEKLLFKITKSHFSSVTYSVLFTGDELVYAAKTN
jgi:hypothetical protein